MSNYNTKQLQPLIDKYQINAETNKLFAHIIDVFDGQPNYQLWGVKMVFSQVITVDDFDRIASWANANKNAIKGLSKQNIVSYNTKSDIASLLLELNGFDKLSFVTSMVSRFNTEQRKMLTERIFGGKKDEMTYVQANSSKNIAFFYDLFKKIERVPSDRRTKLFKNASNVHGDIDTLLARIEDTLKESYAWNKDDCKAYITNNYPKCNIVFDEGPYLIVEIDSFDSSKNICGNSRTSWCITQTDSQWRNYVASHGGSRRQYFYFDFSKPERDDIAHVGFTIQDGIGVVEAQSTSNSCMKNEGISYKGSRVNINDIFERCGASIGLFMSIKKRPPFSWDKKSFLEYAAANEKVCKVVCEKGDVLIVNFLSSNEAKKVFSYSFIQSSVFDNKSELFFLLDFSKKFEDDKSVVLMQYVNDKWGTKSLSNMVDLYGTNITKSGYLGKVGLSSDDFIKRENIKAEVLLHKLIEEKDEAGAIKLINSNEDIDVNYTFEDTIPIYACIRNKMYDLFNVILNHKKYNCNVSNGICGSPLDTLLYVYVSAEIQSEKEDVVILRKMIDNMLTNKKLNINATNINGDSALHIACEFNELSWVLDKLVTRKDVNVNLVDGYGDTPITTAITSDNINAVEVLGKRPDLVVDEKAKTFAAQFKVDYAKFIKPTDSVFASEGSEEYVTEEALAMAFSK